MEASIADARRPMIAAPMTGREILMPLPRRSALLGLRAGLGSAADRLYPLQLRGRESMMFRVALAFGLVFSVCQQLFADEAPYRRPLHYRHGWYLPRERHVIEVVQPPYSGIFIINGIRFTGMTPACFGWAAGEPIGLVAGDWHGHCRTAVFYNFWRRNTCQMWCRAAR
jgi:hypothetical protein